jgi:hypothetical protein
VWPAVEQALQQKRRRRPLLFWWFAGAGTLVFGAVALWMLNSPETTELSAFRLPTALNNTGKTALESPAPSMAAPQLGAEQQVEMVKPVTEVQKTKKNNKEDVYPQANANPAMMEVKSGEVLVQNISERENTAETISATEKATLDIINLPGLSTGSTLAFKAKGANVMLKPISLHARRKKVQPKVCYDFNRHPSAILLDIYAGPSIAQRSLTSRLDDEPYLKQRLTTERRDLAFNAGIRASLMFSRNFLLRTGLHYDQFTEVFEYIDPTSVIYELKFTPGNPIPDTLGVKYGENYLKTYNRYGMLDIPLMVGVEMRSGRSGFNINAGISANVLFWKRGAIMDPQTQEPARYGGKKETLSEDVFRTRLSLSAGASVQWYWHISPHWRLYAEPSFRQVLRPVTLKNHPVEQRYSILGLRLGATKIF